MVPLSMDGRRPLFYLSFRCTCWCRTQGHHEIYSNIFSLFVRHGAVACQSPEQRLRTYAVFIGCPFSDRRHEDLKICLAPGECPLDQETSRPSSTSIIHFLPSFSFSRTLDVHTTTNLPRTRVSLPRVLCKYCSWRSSLVRGWINPPSLDRSVSRHESTRCH